jgi:hypothetical protein
VYPYSSGRNTSCCMGVSAVVRVIGDLTNTIGYELRYGLNVYRLNAELNVCMETSIWNVLNRRVCLTSYAGTFLFCVGSFTLVRWEHVMHGSVFG